MKKKKLIACIAAGVIAVGGAGTVGGIALHNHNKNQDALAALESQISELADAVTATETELVTETETQTVPKPTETQAKPTQPTQAPQTTVAPPTCTEPEKITWEYDAELSRQVSELIVQQSSSTLNINVTYDPNRSRKEELGPGNFVHENAITAFSAHSVIADYLDQSNPARQIVDKWFPAIPPSLYTYSRFCIDVFRYSNGFYIAFFSH